MARATEGRVITERGGTVAGSNHRTGALWNRGLVLRLLREHKALSRRQISSITGLRGSTLTYIVRELTQKGFVVSAGKLNTKRAGQRQVMLNVNRAFGYALGIALRPGVARVVLVDAAEQGLATTRFAMEGKLETVPSQLRAGIDRWLTELGAPAGRLLGVGVGLPGVVDPHAGEVLYSTSFHTRSVPLRKLLAEQFGDLVQIDHDACFGALAESDEGAARDASHFLYFAINHNAVGTGADAMARLDSYGSALFLEGRVYRGAHFAAGEHAARLRPRDDLLANPHDLACFAAADAPLTPVLGQLADSFGDVLADIVNFLDVGLIVVGGNCHLRNAQFLNAVRAKAEQRLLPVPGRVLRVIASQLGDDAVARGAALAACRTAIEGTAFLLNDSTSRVPRAATPTRTLPPPIPAGETQPA